MIPLFLPPIPVSIELLIGYVAFASAIGSVFGLGLVCVATVLLERWRKRNAPDDLEARLDAAERRLGELLRTLDELKVPLPAVLETMEQGVALKNSGCVVCGNTRVRIKAKGKCKKCYEREGARKRYRAKAEVSSRR